MTEQIIIFFQIIFIDLVLAGDNAIVIGMVASQFPTDQRKKSNFCQEFLHRFDEIFDFAASKPHSQAVQVEAAFQSRRFCLNLFCHENLMDFLTI